MKTTIIIFTFLFSLISYLQAQEPADTIWARRFEIITDAKFTPSGDKLVILDRNGIHVTNPLNGEIEHTFYTSAQTFDMSNDGSYIISSDMTKRSLINPDEEIYLEHEGVIIPTDVEIDDVNSRVLFATCNVNDENNRIRVFDLETLSPLSSVGLNICLDYIKVSNDGNYIAVYGFDDRTSVIKNKILLLDKDFNIIKEIYSEEFGVAEMHFSNDSESLYFIAKGYNKYDIETENLSKISYLTKGYTDFALSKDDKYIVSNYLTNLNILNINDFNDSRVYALRTLDVWDVDSKGYIACGDNRNMYLLNLFNLVSVEEDNNNTFQVYPNPFTDQLSITNVQLPIEENKIEVLDIMGNVVHKEKLTLNSTPLTLNLGALLPGTYFVKIGDRVEKVVKN